MSERLRVVSVSAFAVAGSQVEGFVKDSIARKVRGSKH